MHIGDKFTVLGRNFDSWPEEIVAFTEEEFAITTPSSNIVMKVVERTNFSIILEAFKDVDFTHNRVYAFFASPIELPRTLLYYSLD